MLNRQQQSLTPFKLPDEILVLEIDSLLPNANNVIRAYGGIKGKEHLKVSKTIDSAIQKASSLIRPRAAWSKLIYSIETSQNFAVDNQDIDFPEGFAKSMAVVCTIGGALETKAKLMARQGDYLFSYILDLVGSLTIAKLADQVTACILPKGNAQRVAPGDRRTPLSLQSAIFKSVSTTRIGVQLTHKQMMVPLKSLSFVLFPSEKTLGKNCSIPCIQCAWNGSCDRKNDLHN